MKRRDLALGAGVAALGGLAGLAGYQFSRGGPEAPPGLWAMRFARPEGGELDLGSLRGKPLLINFWATWCPPCVRELPDLERFQQAFGAQGGQVVALAIDGPTPVRDFVARNKLSLPVGLAGLDGSELARQLGNEQGALPFSVLIAATGRIAQRKLGQTSHEELTRWLSKLS